MSLLRYAQMTPIAFKPILCVKITSKLVFFTVSTARSIEIVPRGGPPFLVDLGLYVDEF